MSSANTNPRGLAFELLRVVIELQSPLAIGSGLDDELRDRPCVVSADGLPAIPGSSLAGALRRAVAGRGDPSKDPAACRAFGTLGGDGVDARPSAVEVSWGQVHDSADVPAPLRSADLADPVLAGLRAPVVRDHVRIDGYGAAAHRGKFDEDLVPCGARFTFELVVHDDAGLDGATLVGLLEGGTIRLGGGTRKGHGEFRVVRAHGRAFDLEEPVDREIFRAVPRRIEIPVGVDILPELEPYEATSAAGVLSAAFTLEAESTWMFGGGSSTFDAHTRGGKDADLVPWTEDAIGWVERPDGGWAGEERTEFVAPASGLKGALRHRVAYHARRLSGAFWSPDIGREHSEEVPAEVDLLFGAIKDGDEGRPGRVYLSDVRLDAAHAGAWLDHVSLDRFTAGPLDGHLFSEAPLRGGRIELRLAIDTRGFEQTAEAEQARRALGLALRDLASGHLGIGAGTTKGHGTFRGDLGSMSGELKSWLMLEEAER